MQQIHEIAKHLLIDTEVFLCSDKYATWPKFDILKRYSTRWWKFLKSGIAEIFKPVILYSFITFSLAIIVGWLWSSTKIQNPEILSNLLLMCQLLPIFIIAFALPSTYSDRGIPKDIPSSMSNYLRNEIQISSTKEIDALKKSVKIFEARAKARITVMKWLFGLCWAGFTYLISKFWDISQNQVPSTNDIRTLLIYFTVGLFIVIAGYVLVWGYEAAVERLFQSIEVGTNQASLDLELEKKT